MITATQWSMAARATVLSLTRYDRHDRYFHLTGLYSCFCRLRAGRLRPDCLKPRGKQEGNPIAYARPPTSDVQGTLLQLAPYDHATCQIFVNIVCGRTLRDKTVAKERAKENAPLTAQGLAGTLREERLSATGSDHHVFPLLTLVLNH